MKKEFRIKKNEDFSLAVKKGKRISNNDYTIYIIDNNLNHLRVGVSVSKKIGNAVIRSTTRRKMRVIVDTTLDFSKYSKDIVVVAKKPLLDKSFKDILESFNNLKESI